VVLPSEASQSSITIEISGGIASLLRMVVEEIGSLTSRLPSALVEAFEIPLFQGPEDPIALLEFSTGILVVHWICIALSSFMDTFMSPTLDTKSTVPLTSRFLFHLIGVLNTAFTDLDSLTTHNHTENIASTIKDRNDIGGTSFASSSTGTLTYVSPAAVMVIGPLMVITLTCIMADNNYYIFATVFAPIVDQALLTIKSFFTPATSYQEQWDHRAIPDDEETSDGVLWGMIMLFCLESVLVGSIMVMVVLISLLSTILTSASTMLSSHDDPEMVGEKGKILVGFLCSWVACVVTTNVLRMALYQTIDNDD